MKIIDVVCSGGRTGFYFDDQRAIKAGAGHDGVFYTGKTVTEGNNSGIENTVRALGGMTADDGVGIITPDGHKMTFGAVLPGHVFQFGSKNLSHNKYLTIHKLCFA